MLLTEHKELKKSSGDIFFEVRRMPGNAFIYVNWIGIQSLETIVMGYNQILGMLRNKPCKGVLNSNRELIGPWDAAVNWMNFKWRPQAKELGLVYFAHVLSPGIYGQRSFKLLYPSFKDHFEIRSFDDETLAADWLRSKTATE